MTPVQGNTGSSPIDDNRINMPSEEGKDKYCLGNEETPGDCCGCCGGPCYDSCQNCPKTDAPESPGSIGGNVPPSVPPGGGGLESDGGNPTCCMPRCCTCFPGFNGTPDLELVTGEHPLEFGQKPDYLNHNNYPKQSLEAAIYLTGCKKVSQMFPYETVDNTTCLGYLGSITLKGGAYIEGTELDGDEENGALLKASCIRHTSQEGGEAPGGSPGRGGSQDCTKQICGQSDQYGQGPLPIYEIWCGQGVICAGDTSDSKKKPPNGMCKDAPHRCCGQRVEISVCCCMGNNDEGPCQTNQYKCTDLKDKAEQPEGPDIDEGCSCACYMVRMNFLPPKESDLQTRSSETLPFLGDPKCSAEAIIPGSHQECMNNQKPGCEDGGCDLTVTDCKCMDPTSTCNDGWYICATTDRGEITTAPLSCDCCPGDVTNTAGGNNLGGCVPDSVQFGVFISPLVASANLEEDEKDCVEVGCGPGDEQCIEWTGGTPPGTCDTGITPC